MTVDSHLNAIFGEETVRKLHASKVLLVGAGGIGCELLKDLITMNYGEIHIADLDTIDLSNLNRQFLFRQKDIKKSKSLTAVEAVSGFNHSSQLIPYHGNIMDKNTFPLSWFQQFDIIFNALDNVEARVYVNKMALFTKTTLMESGTTGLKGQVQPIYPYQTECFQCVAKETPKTFPVCTIRSTPSKPIHCITWAKNFLLLQLFGEDSDSSSEAVTTDDSDNREELEALNKESNELKELKSIIKSNSENFDESKIDYILEILTKIFNDDIETLLRIDELWESRTKPIPLNVSEVYSDLQKQYTKVETTANANDQSPWDILENLYIFIDSTKRLTKRYAQEEYDIEFDKDDKDTLDFVVSAANLRSHIFDIPIKSKFDVKQIAGNIIPAVATTNAIIAGVSALQSLHYYSSDPVGNSRMVYDSEYISKFLAPVNLSSGNPTCVACSLPRGIVTLDEKKTTLSQLRDAIMAKYDIYEDDIGIVADNGARLLYDFDFEDNLDKELSVIGVKCGDVLMILDSEEVYKPLELYVEKGTVVVLPDVEIGKSPKKIETEEDKEEEMEEADDIWKTNDDGVIELDEEEGEIVIEEDDILEIIEDDEPEEDGHDAKRRKVA